VTRILAISDTHAKKLGVLPKSLLAEIGKADIVVHCGDYIDLSLLEELRHSAKRFVGVFGNMDSTDIRREVPAKTVFEVEGRRIGVIHPHWGGAAIGVEEAIAEEFHGVDMILYGHTHDASCETRDGVTFVNPGQAYADDTAKATAGIVMVGDKGFEIEIVSF
jgi:hypothetical protein